MIDQTTLDEIRRLAEAAGSLTWKTHLVDETRVVDEFNNYVATTWDSEYAPDEQMNHLQMAAYAVFIAKSNPRAILTLLDALEEARRELGELRVAKWEVKHVDTMNDLASARVAIDGLEADRDTLREEVKRLREALEPFYAAVLTDNGCRKQLAVNVAKIDPSAFISAYHAFRRAREAIKEADHG